jgi:predicted Holliday junction resolvase-like endonuclease|tara:strand:+ start:407 stop:772 length:366 start_codon:yes stop_codon:yes gene_type:complete
MIEIIGIIIIAFLLYYIHRQRKNIETLELKYKKTLSAKKSTEVRTGYAVENLVPFMKDFKYNPEKLQFMGMPIDYIHFGEDKITFIEVKSGKARLSVKQRKIKKLIQENKVDWDEIRIKTK